MTTAALASGALCNIAAGSKPAQGSIRAAGGVGALLGLVKRGAALAHARGAAFLSARSPIDTILCGSASHSIFPNTPQRLQNAFLIPTVPHFLSHVPPLSLPTALCQLRPATGPPWATPALRS